MSWDELVAAALVGTDRRPVHPAPPPGAPEGLGTVLQAEDGLLAAAAAWAVARRAGALPGAPREVEPAPQDPRPLCSPEAGARLRDLLAADELVEEWLGLAAARRLRPPPELVPALLGWAEGVADRAGLAVDAAGPLGPWLAARNPAWRFLPERWDDGPREARRLLLARLRATDPAAARELLETTFAQETAEDREAFVETLAINLSDADEPFLEAALHDRRQGVRLAAAELLARLPGSRLAARMAERAKPLLTLRDGRLVVALPGEPDAAARRDGIPRETRRALTFQRILHRTPLRTWTEAFGRTPEEILRLPVADDFAGEVHAGFAGAAAAQRDAAWARALWLAEPLVDHLLVLPKAERERLAASGADMTSVVAELPPPWGAELSSAIAAHVRRLVERDQAFAIPYHAAYGLDPAVLPQLEALREAGGRQVDRLCDILATRAAMLRELS